MHAKNQHHSAKYRTSKDRFERFLGGCGAIRPGDDITWPVDDPKLIRGGQYRNNASYRAKGARHIFCAKKHGF